VKLRFVYKDDNNVKKIFLQGKNNDKEDFWNGNAGNSAGVRIDGCWVRRGTPSDSPNRGKSKGVDRWSHSNYME
jgi:hypothetical protein